MCSGSFAGEEQKERKKLLTSALKGVFVNEKKREEIWCREMFVTFVDPMHTHDPLT